MTQIFQKHLYTYNIISAWYKIALISLSSKYCPTLFSQGKQALGTCVTISRVFCHYLSQLVVHPLKYTKENTIHNSKTKCPLNANPFWENVRKSIPWEKKMKIYSSWIVFTDKYQYVSRIKRMKRLKRNATLCLWLKLEGKAPGKVKK